jgi:hypothetical protein
MIHYTVSTKYLSAKWFLIKKRRTPQRRHYAFFMTYFFRQSDAPEASICVFLWLTFSVRVMLQKGHSAFFMTYFFRQSDAPEASLCVFLWLTFSVRVTLRLLKVENPDEHSVSVGELGQEWVSRTASRNSWLEHSGAFSAPLSQCLTSQPSRSTSFEPWNVTPIYYC